MSSKAQRKFEEKANRINMKKTDMTREYITNLCVNKTKKSSKAIKRDLKRYAEKMSKLEMKKYGIRRPLAIKETKNPEIYGSMSYSKGLKAYRTKNGPRLRYGSVMSLNYGTVISMLRSKDEGVRIKGFVKYMETVHHEMGHLEQHVATENYKKIADVSPEYALKYALEFVDIAEKRKIYYEKGKNYDRMLIEKNAREKGLENAMDVISKAYNKRAVQTAFSHKLEKAFDDGFVELENLESDEGLREREEMTTEIADKAVKRNPGYIKKMPILETVYTLDGNRKPIYHTVKEAATARRKIRLNPFLSKERRDEKLKEVNDLYSEVFTESLKQCSAKDVELAQKVLGNKAFRGMIGIAKNHYIEKYNEYVKSAEQEKDIRDRMEGTTRTARTIYNQRLYVSEEKIAPTVEMLDEVSEYVKKNKTTKMTPTEAKKQFKIDELKVKNNIKMRNVKGNSKNVKLNSEIEFEDIIYNDKVAQEEVQEYEMKQNEMDIDIDGMRDLRDEYEKNKEHKLDELEETKNQYYDLTEKQKEDPNIEINQR